VKKFDKIFGTMKLLAPITRLKSLTFPEPD